MDNERFDNADRYFRERLGIDLETLLAPIADDDPTGENLRGQGVYRAIREARRGDDASLPTGDRSPRRPDWETVTNTAVEALTNRSKDLRLAAWLTEARLHSDGIAALPAGLTLLTTLSERFWDALHPEMVDDDPAYRTNIFDWLDQETATILKLATVTATPRQQPDYTLADWERAVRTENQRDGNDTGTAEATETDTATIAQAFSRTGDDFLRSRIAAIRETRGAIHPLAQTLALTCSSDAPAFGHLREVLDDLETLLRSELDRRGPATEVDPDPVHTETEETAVPQSTPAGSPTNGIRSRADAYAWLTAAARYLADAEPHSPIPYVVDRTVEWGNMNAAELYRELFVENGGQLNVFDLMGIGEQTATHAGE